MSNSIMEQIGAQLGNNNLENEKLLTNTVCKYDANNFLRMQFNGSMRSEVRCIHSDFLLPRFF